MKKVFALVLLLALSAPHIALCTEAGPLSFLVFGDFGQGTSNQKKVGKAMEKFCAANPCDFMVGVGDNFYPKGVKSGDDPKWKTHFLDIYGPLNLIYYASLGNHDYGGNYDAQVEYSKKTSLWYMPSRYYTFKKPGADFIAIDTNNLNKTQTTWLDEQLAKPRDGWRIVYGHHPIYSYGPHGETESMVEKILPRLKNKADFYFCGHDHGKQLLTAGDELTLLVSGSAAEVTSVGKGAHLIYGAATLGFAQVILDKDLATIRFIDKDAKVEYERSFAPNF